MKKNVETAAKESSRPNYVTREGRPDIAAKIRAVSDRVMKRNASIYRSLQDK